MKFCAPVSPPERAQTVGSKHIEDLVSHEKLCCLDLEYFKIHQNGSDLEGGCNIHFYVCCHVDKIGNDDDKGSQSVSFFCSCIKG